MNDGVDISTNSGRFLDQDFYQQISDDRLGIVDRSYEILIGGGNIRYAMYVHKFTYIWQMQQFCYNGHMATPQTYSWEELKKLRAPLRNVNIAHKERLSRLERLALWITGHVGTMGFFFVIFAWTALWLGWNIAAPAAWRFDPYPAFVLWLFISNMIQIFLMPLLLIGQNLQGKHSAARAEADFEVNTKAEREIEAILRHLENQSDLISQILRHLEGKK